MQDFGSGWKFSCKYSFWKKVQFLAEESAMIIYLVEFLPIHFFFFTLEKSSCYLHNVEYESSSFIVFIAILFWLYPDLDEICLCEF